MRKDCTRWGIFVTVAAGLMSSFASNAAMANCTGADNARLNAMHPRQSLLIRRVQAGECSFVPELIRKLADGNAILSDTERRISTGNNPLRCSMHWKKLPTISTCRCRIIGHNYACDSSATRTAKAAPPAPANEQAAAHPAVPAPARQPQQSGACSDITGSGGGSGPSNCQPSTSVPPNVQAQINQTQSNRTADIKAPQNTSPPSKGEALESLRDLMPDLGRLLDATADAVNSPNIPPPDQWTNVSTPPLAAKPSPPRTDPSRSEPKPSQNDQPNAPTMTADAPPEQTSPIQDSPDDDYAAICKSESVKNGLKSLKQDFEAAQKDEQGRFGIKFFREKLKLQWATLKKCVRDPMQKAVLDKLDRDPIIHDPDADNQQTITPK